MDRKEEKTALID